MNVKFDGMHNEHPTNELRGTVIPQGTLSCPSGNSPCRALRETFIVIHSYLLPPNSSLE